MGSQKWAETAGILRSGFEDAIEDIFQGGTAQLTKPEDVPPPFIQEGYWANYDDIENTFKDDWKNLEETKHKFFSFLWKKRTKSPLRTFFWFLSQQLKLIDPRVIYKISLFAWLLYIPLQLVSFTVLLYLMIRHRKIMSEILGDVRLYISPEGIIERAIVQRIDKRVGEEFLRMIGLDWNFEPLADDSKIKVNNMPIEFDRIIWVAHSLGTVISYNVLSDLFQRTDELKTNGTPEQQRGVEKFRQILRRFVTLGSPLDKIAFLFKQDALRPWPDIATEKLFGRIDEIKVGEENYKKERWVNFYHVLDPVSGALSNPIICGSHPPINYHIGIWKIPWLAHTSYWRDTATLKYILSRVYSKDFLPVSIEKPYSPLTLTLIACFGYFIWAALILIAAYLIIDYGPDIVTSIIRSIFGKGN
jgi:hypothetical protein